MRPAVVSFDGNTVRSGDACWQAPFAIDTLTTIGHTIILLFKRPDHVANHEHFPNLSGYTQSGRKLWTADHPTGSAPDHYYRIVSSRPLVVLSAASYECTIDHKTGKILKSLFFK